jgi:hypothetical protein
MSAGEMSAGDDEDTLPGPVALAGAASLRAGLPDGEDTVARAPVAQRPVAPSEPAPAELVEPAAPEFAEPAAVVPGPAPWTPPPARRAPVPRLAVHGGPTLPLDAPVRLGRSPAPPRIPERVALVTVPSAGGTVSSSHLEIRPSGHGVVLRDLGSLNGSRVEVPGSAPRVLARGDSMVVPVGTRVVLGEGVEVTVLPPEGEERS